MQYLPWGAGFLGLWIMVSPWILGFSDITPALWSNVVAGVFIILIAMWEIFLPRE
ncbi:SPW repeat protein [Candidatus Wolfebacteria bacterium]|nr:SPW repeat protein [Candidatus Wolfebacteria bacterium]